MAGIFRVEQKLKDKPYKKKKNNKQREQIKSVAKENERYQYIYLIKRINRVIGVNYLFIN